MNVSLPSSLYPSLYFGESIVSDDSVTWDSNFVGDLLADIILNLSPIELSFFFVGEMGEAVVVVVVVIVASTDDDGGDDVDDEDDDDSDDDDCSETTTDFFIPQFSSSSSSLQSKSSTLPNNPLTLPDEDDDEVEFEIFPKRLVTVVDFEDLVECSVVILLLLVVVVVVVVVVVWLDDDDDDDSSCDDKNDDEEDDNKGSRSWINIARIAMISWSTIPSTVLDTAFDDK